MERLNGIKFRSRIILGLQTFLKRVGFAILVLGGGAAHAEWQRVHEFEDELTWVVRFQDAERGWAGPALLPPYLYRTTNGGFDWTPIEEFPGNGYVAEIEFWGSKRIAVATLNSVTTSSDSGVTWSAIALPGGGYATEIAYADSNLIFAIGTDDQLLPPTRKQIHRSLDGGQTWTRVFYEIDHEGWSINDVAYSASGTVIVGSAPWEVLRSTNQGINWQSIGDEDPNLFPILEVNALVSPSSGVFIAAGAVDTLPGLLGFPIIARSSDDGQTWNIVWQNPTAYDSMIYDLSFADSLNGWAVGRNGTFLRTTDGGETWTWSVFDSIRFGFVQASYLSTSMGFVFDPGGGGGSLWRWDTTTAVVEDDHDRSEITGTQISVFPNPFNAEATFRIELARPSQVQVKIYDLCGRIVAGMSEQYRSEGIHSLKLGLVPLATGMYIYRVTADKYPVGQGKILHLK
ncbi:MAG: T9SS type A sorting domain-containing protein [bacterium]|nr:T9SS type A sorting domain-containing protein [bacterium]